MKNKFFITAGLYLLMSVAPGFGAEKSSESKTYILGHWNREPNSIENVYVVSEGDDVELFINDISFGHGRPAYDNLFVFDNVIFQPGILTAVSRDLKGNELSRSSLNTAGAPAQLILTAIPQSGTIKANDEDKILIQVEVADFQGKRCGNDHRAVSFEIEGPAEWMGALPLKTDGSLPSKKIMVDNGIGRAVVKNNKTPGSIKITAKAEGLAPVEIAFP